MSDRLEDCTTLAELHDFAQQLLQMYMEDENSTKIPTSAFATVKFIAKLVELTQVEMNELRREVESHGHWTTDVHDPDEYD